MNMDNINYCPDIYHRRSIRLQGYDYGQAGAYFVTVVMQDRAGLFGEIADGAVALNDVGNIVAEEWTIAPSIRNNISLDAFVIMPNHLHGIIVIHDDCRGTMHRAPTREQFGQPTSNSIPTIIRGFKSAVTKRINEHRTRPGMPVWQRNYYEHVIRDDDELNALREYVINNPATWQEDEYRCL